ncbi:DUF4493 domain-containing protein [Bacteroides sp. An322]|uniref:DUF4493 domain-containing protein n=1 Tax=Bacteroides sp. An322 TaxID=1965632 RepID=UPI000B3651D1|nr:DUF4493 domain-containing protein [Bacteroides sp. An322]OUO24222.1 hypothetical protein B5F91_01125 [Bacteroides sp. An322]
MKLFNTITACLMLCAGLVSCEMKDELKGSGAGTSEVGYLNLGVAVNASQNSVVSRADNANNDGENVGVAVSADDFPVTITGVTDPSYSKEYESYAALKAENGGKVELPIGEYTVTAHSNAELEPQMATPYYEGTTPIKITAGVESSAEVKCTMKNMKIQLTYTANFLTKFESWDITINDGSDNILNFDETDKNPAAVYWMVAENVTEIKVAITATPTGGGQEVTESRLLSKPDGSNWAGSDALTIQMEENTSEDPTGIQGSGITINASVSFDEEEEDVPVTVKPGNDGDDDNKEPEPPTPTPEPELPTVTFPQNTYTLPDDMEADADILIQTALKNGSSDEYVGLKNVLVKIIPGNQGFKDALDFIKDMADFTGEGVDLVGNTSVEPLLQYIAPSLKVPVENAPNYSFPVGAFFETLLDIGTTGESAHVFEIMVTDNNGNSLSEPVRLNIVVE